MTHVSFKELMFRRHLRKPIIRDRVYRSSHFKQLLQILLNLLLLFWIPILDTKASGVGHLPVDLSVFRTSAHVLDSGDHEDVDVICFFRLLGYHVDHIRGIWRETPRGMLHEGDQETNGSIDRVGVQDGRVHFFGVVFGVLNTLTLHVVDELDWKLNRGFRIRFRISVFIFFISTVFFAF